MNRLLIAALLASLALVPTVSAEAQLPVAAEDDRPCEAAAQKTDLVAYEVSYVNDSHDCVGVGYEFVLFHADCAGPFTVGPFTGNACGGWLWIV